MSRKSIFVALILLFIGIAFAGDRIIPSDVNLAILNIFEAQVRYVLPDVPPNQPAHIHVPRSADYTI